MTTSIFSASGGFRRSLPLLATFFAVVAGSAAVAQAPPIPTPGDTSLAAPPAKPPPAAAPPAAAQQRPQAQQIPASATALDSERRQACGQLSQMYRALSHASLPAGRDFGVTSTVFRNNSMSRVITLAWTQGCNMRPFIDEEQTFIHSILSRAAKEPDAPNARR